MGYPVVKMVVWTVHGELDTVEIELVDDEMVKFNYGDTGFKINLRRLEAVLGMFNDILFREEVKKGVDVER